MNVRSFFRGLLVATFLTAFPFAAGAAEPARPSWTCVPDETALLARVPNAAAFIEAIQTRTRFGHVVLSPSRFDRIVELVRESAGDKWEDVVKELSKMGLKPDDLKSLAGGEAGLAIVVEPREGRAPLVLSLSWIEPGDEIGGRMFEAIQKSVEEQREKREPTVRLDIELAGQQVMHLAVPEYRVEFEEGDEDSAPDPKKATKEELKAWRQKRADRAKHIPTGQTHVLATRLGGRILTATTLSQLSADEQAKLADPNEKVDLAAATGLEETKGIFSRFLAAHAEAGGQPTLPILATPGLMSSLPAGIPLIEMFGDPRPLWKLVPQDETTSTRLFRALAIDQIGPIAARFSLEGTELRSGFFLSAPAPRKGLLALLDQPALPSDPPAWVPADVVDYTQTSFHFGKAYAAIKELVIAELGDSARQGFDFIELQVNNSLQTDLEALLSSLGQQQISLTFPPLRKAPRGDAEATAAPLDRVSLVAQIKDEAVWKRVLGVVQSHSPDGAAEEQGFTGVRFSQAGFEGGLFIGRGYLVLGIGPETIEPTLQALRNPPTGDQALRSGAVYRRATDLVPAQPGLAYSVTDGNRQLRALRQSIVEMFDEATKLQATPDGLKNNPELPDPAMLEKLRALLPSEDELDGTFGVGVSDASVDAHGLKIRSTLDLPAP